MQLAVRVEQGLDTVMHAGLGALGRVLAHGVGNSTRPRHPTPRRSRRSVTPRRLNARAC